MPTRTFFVTSTDQAVLDAPIPQLGSLYRALRRLQRSPPARHKTRAKRVFEFSGPHGKESELELGSGGRPVRWAAFASGELLEEVRYEWAIRDGKLVPARIVETFHSRIRTLKNVTSYRWTSIVLEQDRVPTR